ncbi:MAG: S-layer homology domain-containing protein [Clostridia bacterium]|nr:S-layer homology domain-containing protein [Clostridia bacterium]
MKILKKSIALILVLLLVSGSVICFAADSDKQYNKYEKVLLLGDSESSGFTDYGDEFSEFTRVDDSYAAYVADDLGAELIPMACPGFRTMELRCMLDDNYYPANDPYLFKKVPRTSEADIMAKAPQMRQAIKESDLIVIGIGGNDWGAYLGWVQEDTLAANILPEEYRTALIELLNNAKVGDDVIGMAIELADYLNAVDELMPALVEAFKYGFSNLYENWEYIIEYIYENNPDVTIAVVGMFPTYLKTEEGKPYEVAEPDAASKAVEDAIIAFANKHMIEGRDKYGYLYIDTEGTVVEVCHPTVAGHRHIADRILAALPDARFPYTDITISHKAYKAVEYMYLNGIMSGVDATTFGADTIINEAEFAELLGKVTDYEASGSDKELKKIKMASEVYKASGKNEFLDILSLIVDMIQMIFNGEAFKAVTRADAALAIYNLVK